MLSYLRKKAGFATILFLVGAMSMTMACRQKTPEDRLAEAQKLVEERQMVLSIIKLKDLIQEHPEADEALEARLMLAQLYASQQTSENIRKAIEQLEAIWNEAGLDTQMGQEAYRVQTGMLGRLKEYDKALEHARLGIERFSVAEPSAQDQMRLIYGSLLLGSEEPGQKEEGIAIFEESIKDASSDEMRSMAKQTLAEYYSTTEQYDKSNEVYQNWIDNNPEDTANPQFKIAMAINYRAAENKEAAEATFEEGAEAMRQQIEGELDNMRRAEQLNLLAQYYQVFGQYDRAEEALRRVMAEMPMSRQAIMAQFGIGDLYARTGDFDKSREVFEQIARENPNSNIAQQAQQLIQQVNAAAEAADAAPATETTSEEATASGPTENEEPAEAADAP